MMGQTGFGFREIEIAGRRNEDLVCRLLLLVINKNVKREMNNGNTKGEKQL